MEQEELWRDSLQETSQGCCRGGGRGGRCWQRQWTVQTRRPLQWRTQQVLFNRYKYRKLTPLPSFFNKHSLTSSGHTSCFMRAFSASKETYSLPKLCPLVHGTKSATDPKSSARFSRVFGRTILSIEIATVDAIKSIMIYVRLRILSFTIPVYSVKTSKLFFVFC